MRKFPFLICSCVLVCGIAAGQGLTPKAGAASDGLYTNLYFGMNYKLPADWEISYVASDGACDQECMLLNAQAPEAKSRRAVTVTAERIAAGGGQQVIARAAATLEQLGAKKIAPAKETSVAGRKAYRADFRSNLVNTEVYYSVITLIIPSKEYAVVFSFSSESRKHLDSVVEALANTISFVGQS